MYAKYQQVSSVEGSCYECYRMPLLQVKAEIRDAATAHSQERQDLENTVNELNRELKLK
jgi:hypothetical protein